jgi:glycerophosphoryl diester phosphodiesterase
MFYRSTQSLAMLIAHILLTLTALLSLSHGPLPAPPGPEGNPTIHQRLEGFSIGAHRGGSWHINNNTLPRFEAARRDGADVIEMDLHLTKDGVVLIAHDGTVGLFNKRPLSELTLQQIRTRPMPFRSPMPTFEEVLQWARGRVVINAELKEDAVVEPAVRLVQKYNAHEWVYFQTKSREERYHTARQLDPQVALLFKPMNTAQLDWALGLNDDRLVVIEIDPTMRRPEVIDRAHAAGKKISYNAWRLDRFHEFFTGNCDDVFALGIDIAISKRPERCDCPE